MIDTPALPFDATAALAAFRERQQAKQIAEDQELEENTERRARSKARRQAAAIKSAQGGQTACEFCGWDKTTLRAYYTEPAYFAEEVEADGTVPGTIVWLCPNDFKLMRKLIPVLPTRTSVLETLDVAVRGGKS